MDRREGDRIERRREVDFLLGAMRESLTAGGEYLAHRRFPTGPICHVRNVSYMHKAVWGMYAGGVDHDILAEVLDWVGREAYKRLLLREEELIPGRSAVYRPLTFLRWRCGSTIPGRGPEGYQPHPPVPASVRRLQLRRRSLSGTCGRLWAPSLSFFGI